MLRPLLLAALCLAGRPGPARGCQLPTEWRPLSEGCRAELAEIIVYARVLALHQEVHGLYNYLPWQYEASEAGLFYSAEIEMLCDQAWGSMLEVPAGSRLNLTGLGYFSCHSHTVVQDYSYFFFLRMDENYNLLPHGVNFQDAIFPDTRTEGCFPAFSSFPTAPKVSSRQLSPVTGRSRKTTGCPVTLVVGDQAPHEDAVVECNSKLDPTQTSFLKMADSGGQPQLTQPGKLTEAFKYFLQGMGYMASSCMSCLSRSGTASLTSAASIDGNRSRSRTLSQSSESGTPSSWPSEHTMEVSC